MSLADEYHENALASALDAVREGRPLRACYATPRDRLTACALRQGHEGPHNARHDRSGRGWAS